ILPMKTYHGGKFHCQSHFQSWNSISLTFRSYCRSILEGFAKELLIRLHHIDVNFLRFPISESHDHRMIIRLQMGKFPQKNLHCFLNVFSRHDNVDILGGAGLVNPTAKSICSNKNETEVIGIECLNDLNRRNEFFHSECRQSG